MTAYKSLWHWTVPVSVQRYSSRIAEGEGNSVTVRISGGTLYERENGVEEHFSERIYRAGDFVRFRVTSASQELTVRYVVIEMDSVPYVLAVCTDTNGILLLDETDETHPLDFNAIAQKQEISFFPINAPFLHTYHLVDRRVYTGPNSYHTVSEWKKESTLPLESPTGFDSQEEEFIFITDTYNKRVLRVRESTKQLAQIIELDEAPLSIARAVAAVDEDEIYFFFVSLSNSTIVRLDPINQYKIGRTIPIPSTAVYLYDGPNNSIWAACEDDTILKISFDMQLNATVETIVLEEGAGPNFIERTNFGLCVSCLHSNNIAVINESSKSVRYIDVGKRPTGLCSEDNTLLVACEREIVRINSSEITDRFSTELGATRPTRIHKANGFLYVLDAAEKAVAIYRISYNQYTYEDSLVLEGDLTLETPLDFVESNGTFSIYSNVPNAPSQIIPWIAAPTNLSFAADYNAPLNTALYRDYVVEGINAAVPISIYPSGSYVYANGERVYNGHYVSPGDVVRVRINTGNIYEETHKVGLTVGTRTATFTARTLVKNIPDSIEFEKVINAARLQSYTSNEQVISGLIENSTVPASIISGTGTFALNGVQELTSAEIRNGDRIQISQSTADAYGRTQTTTLLYGDKTAQFVTVTELPVYVPPGPQYVPLAEIMVFANKTEVPISSQVFSNTVTIDRLLAPVDIELIGESAVFYHNGTDAGTTATLNNGDTIQLAITTVEHYQHKQEVLIQSEEGIIEWYVITELDYTPYYFAFEELFDCWPKEEYFSEEAEIQGLSPDTVATATVSPACSVIKNGIRLNHAIDSDSEDFEFTVRNGDVIQLCAWAGRPFGETASHKLQIGYFNTTFNVSSFALDGAWENPFNENYGRTELPVGEFRKNAKKFFIDAARAEPTVVRIVEAEKEPITAERVSSVRHISGIPLTAERISSVRHISGIPLTAERISSVRRIAGIPLAAERISSVRHISGIPLTAERAVKNKFIVDNRQSIRIASSVQPVERVESDLYHKNNIYVDRSDAYIRIELKHRYSKAASFVKKYAPKYSEIQNSRFSNYPFKTQLVDSVEFIVKKTLEERSADAVFFKKQAARPTPIDNAAQKSITHGFNEIVPEPSVAVRSDGTQVSVDIFKAKPSTIQLVDSVYAKSEKRTTSDIVRQKDDEGKDVSPFFFVTHRRALTESRRHDIYRKKIVFFTDKPIRFQRTRSYAEMPKGEFVLGTTKPLHGMPSGEFRKNATKPLHGMPSGEFVIDTTKPLHGMPSGELRENATKVFPTLPNGEFVIGTKKPLHGMPSGEFRKNATKVFSTMPKGEFKENATKILSKRPLFTNQHLILHEDPNHLIVTPEMLNYFASYEDAINAAIANGVDAQNAQAYELYPNCWVWAEYIPQILINTPIESAPTLGWLRGG